MKRILIAFLLIVSFFMGFFTNNIISKSKYTYKKNSELKISEETGEIIENNKVIKTYMEFLNGQRKTSVNGYYINSIIIPTGEPNNLYDTKYTFFDSNRDGIPELHLRTARKYHILIYKNGDLVEWGTPRPYAKLLDNGDFIYTTYYGMRENYIYAIFDSNGIESLIFNFGKNSRNENRVYDEINPPYDIGGIGVSKECYEYISDAFSSLSSEKIKWVVLCESKNID